MSMFYPKIYPAAKPDNSVSSMHSILDKKVTSCVMFVLKLLKQMAGTNS